MSAVDEKEGPKVHCIAAGGLWYKFISYVDNQCGEELHAIALDQGGQHLQLPAETQNIVHIFSRPHDYVPWVKIWPIGGNGCTPPVYVDNGQQISTITYESKFNDITIDVNGHIYHNDTF